MQQHCNRRAPTVPNPEETGWLHLGTLTSAVLGGVESWREDTSAKGTAVTTASSLGLQGLHLDIAPSLTTSLRCSKGRKGRPGERRQHQEDLIKPGKDTAGPCRGRGRNGCRALELGGASEVISNASQLSVMVSAVEINSGAKVTHLKWGGAPIQ